MTFHLLLLSFNWSALLKMIHTKALGMCPDPGYKSAQNKETCDISIEEADFLLKTIISKITILKSHQSSYK